MENKFKDVYIKHKAAILCGMNFMKMSNDKQQREMCEQIFLLKSAEKQFAAYKKKVLYEIALDYASK